MGKLIAVLFLCLAGATCARAQGITVTNIPGIPYGTPCGGNLSGQLPNCSSPATTPGYSPNQPLSGCGVEYVSGLTFTVGQCLYSISGVNYTSPQTNVTLAAADPTNPRLDLIIVDNTGTASVLTGTPAATPVAPTIDPSTQLSLSIGLQVAANATTPTNITTNQIFFNGTEWTQTYTAHIALSTNNPYTGATHSIEATAAVLNNSVKLLDPASGTVNLANVNTLTFYIRSKAKWPTGTSGATAARFLNVFWLNGATQKGTTVVLRDGQFGFSSSNTTTYQQISIPASSFAIAGIPVTTLEIQVSGPSGSSSIGWYIGNITLQAGAGTPPLPTTIMNFRGTWSSSTAYNANDTVVSGGIGYVALASNTNVAVSTVATWAPLAPSATTVVHAIGATFDGAGSALTTSFKTYFTVPYACAIQAWNATVDTGTISYDVWKIATGTAIPTVTQTIMTGGFIGVATGTAIHSTSLTNFTTTAVAANDIFAFTVEAVSGATKASVVLQCQ